LKPRGEGAQLEVDEGSKTSVQLATLPTDGPTGGFFHLGEPLPW
jgi:hypothetical protein